MRIKVLKQVKEDIALARDFYDAQELGVGDYFLTQNSTRKIRSRKGADFAILSIVNRRVTQVANRATIDL